MTSDVVIVGGGVIGLSIARALARNAWRVTLLDRQAPGREASWAGAGILPPASLGGPDDPLTAWTTRTRALWPELSAALRETTGIDNGYRRCGGLRLGDEAVAVPEMTFRPTPAASLETELAAWRSAGARAEPLADRDLRELEPSLASTLRTAVWLPDLCQVRNPWHLRALLADCARLGVDVQADRRVTSLQFHGDHVTGVQTESGDLFAERVVVASGAWSSELLPAELRPVEIEPIRGQIVLLRQSAPTLRRVVECGSRYLVPREDGRVLIGSTEERVGFDPRTTHDGVAGLLEFAYALCPALREAERECEWAGLRPHTTSGRPFIGAVPGCMGLYLAAGHFRAGLHLSPLTAELMRAAMM